MIILGGNLFQSIIPNHAELKFDSRLLIDRLKQKCLKIPWKIQSVVRDILTLKDRMIIFTSHFFRETHTVVDLLSNDGLNNQRYNFFYPMMSHLCRVAYDEDLQTEIFRACYTTVTMKDNLCYYHFWLVVPIENFFTSIRLRTIIRHQSNAQSTFKMNIHNILLYAIVISSLISTLASLTFLLKFDIFSYARRTLSIKDTPLINPDYNGDIIFGSNRPCLIAIIIETILIRNLHRLIGR